MQFLTQENRIYAEDEQGKLVAEATFPSISENSVCLDHTFVDPSLRGQGVAGMLIQEVIAYAKDNRKKIKPVCSYAVSWFEKHPEYAEFITE